jgi:hypothetical protein
MDVAALVGAVGHLQLPRIVPSPLHDLMERQTAHCGDALGQVLDQLGVLAGGHEGDPCRPLRPLPPTQHPDDCIRELVGDRTIGGEQLAHDRPPARTREGGQCPARLDAQLLVDSPSQPRDALGPLQPRMQHQVLASQEPLRLGGQRRRHPRRRPMVIQ